MNIKSFYIGGIICLAIGALAVFWMTTSPQVPKAVPEEMSTTTEGAVEKQAPEQKAPVTSTKVPVLSPNENIQVYTSPSGLYQVAIISSQEQGMWCGYMTGGCVLNVQNKQTGEVYLESKIEDLPALGENISFERANSPNVHWTSDGRLVFIWNWGDGGYWAESYTEFDIPSRTHTLLAELTTGEGCTFATMDANEPPLLIIGTKAAYRCGYEGTKSSGAKSGYDVYTRDENDAPFTFLYTAKTEVALIDQYLKPPAIVEDLFTEEITGMLTAE